MNDKNEKRLHNKNFIEACKNAIDGIIYATTTQSNVKKQLILVIIIMITSLFFELSKIEFLILVISCFLVIFAEMLNTAIETVVDLYVDCYHPKAKIAKDVGAGAVVLSALNGIIVVYFVFAEKLGNIGNFLLVQIANSPANLTFVALILTAIAILAIRAAATKNKYKTVNHKFMPSGQATLAFAVVMSIILNSYNVIVSTLAFILAIMISVNRMDNKQHSIYEIIFGASIGILLPLIIYGLTIFK